MQATHAIFVDLDELDVQPDDETETTVTIGIVVVSRDQYGHKILVEIDGVLCDNPVILRHDDSLSNTRQMLTLLTDSLSLRASGDTLASLTPRILALVPEAIRTYQRRQNRRELQSLTSVDEEPAFVVDLECLLECDGPHDYLVENILAADEQCVIGAPYKTLKTTIAIDLLLSLETGTSFLGKFRVPRRRRTCMISSETSRKQVFSIFRRIAASKGFDESAIVDLMGQMHISFQRPRLDNASHLQGISNLLQQDDYAVLLLDAAYQMMPSGSAGNLMAQSEILCGINDICKAAGTTLVFVHHSKTPKCLSPPGLDDLLWAGWREWARQWILLSRRKRFVEGTGSHKLFLSARSSIGHQGLYDLDVEEGAAIDGWSVSVAANVIGTKSIARKPNAASKQEGQIIAAIKRFPDGESARVIRAASGVRTDKFKPILKSLMESGRIVKCEVEKNGRSEKAIKLSV